METITMILATLLAVGFIAAAAFLLLFKKHKRVYAAHYLVVYDKKYNVKTVHANTVWLPRWLDTELLVGNHNIEHLEDTREFDTKDGTATITCKMTVVIPSPIHMPLLYGKEWRQLYAKYLTTGIKKCVEDVSGSELIQQLYRINEKSLHSMNKNGIDRVITLSLFVEGTQASVHKHDLKKEPTYA